ncbi:hypothetical protein PVAND_013497 [Polypedilum vanderplanki]|uniref:Uncharacterized protein n=1 Tax=Polypedilum vanderplanki TaxID=319348 RepID=A0A9J6CQI0_POLVA|nr:hypothetical protein PVAND_013497 [Polypedilum vanderplanki]
MSASNLNKNTRVIYLIVIVLGVTTNLAGILLINYFPEIFDSLFFKKLALQPGSKSYEFWSEPPQPLYLDVYLFNWTNPEDFTNKSVNPRFDEIGPFRFQEFPSKVNVKFHNDNGTVSYRKSSKYIFVPEESGGRMDDVITSINVIALAAAARGKNWGFVGKKAIAFGLRIYGNNVHVTKTAGEWLFDGFEDPMITLAKSNPFLTDIPTNFDKFGWFYKKNNTDFMLGDFNVDTGIKNINEIGNIRLWNHESSTSFFNGKCAALSGSGGDFFNPNISKDDVLQLFSPEMCRSVPMDFEEEVEIHGIKTLKFSGGVRAVDNGTIFPENKCFCSGQCVPSGLFNVSSCRYGTPVFMSFPHFYHADPYYLQQVDGLQPVKEKHQFFMSFEPKTAIPLEVAARFQINLFVEPISAIDLYRDVPKKFMPILWFEQHVKMSKSIANEIKIVLKMPRWGQLVGIAAAVIGFCIVLVIPLKIVIERLCFSHKRRKIRDFDVNGNALLDKNIEKINNDKNENPETKKLIFKEALYQVGVK